MFDQSSLSRRCINSPSRFADRVVLFHSRALRPPNWQAEWCCGVRVDGNKKLVGFIAAAPASVRVYDE